MHSDFAQATEKSYPNQFNPAYGKRARTDPCCERTLSLSAFTVPRA